MKKSKYLQVNNESLKNAERIAEINGDELDIEASDNLWIRNTISRYDMLSAPEQKEYITQAQSGDHEARKAVVKSNLRLVYSIAEKYTKFAETSGLTFADIFQEGCVALDNAVRKYNINANTAFSSYAYASIRNGILDAIRKFGNTEDSNEYTFEDIDEAEEKADPAAEAEYEYTLNLVATEKITRAIRDIMPELSKREQRILTMSFGLDGRGIKSEHEIAEELKLKQIYVNAIRNNTLNKIKRYMFTKNE